MFNEIVLHTFGSWGDIEPYIYLALGLNDLGYKTSVWGPRKYSPLPHYVPVAPDIPDDIYQDVLEYTGRYSHSDHVGEKTLYCKTDTVPDPKNRKWIRLGTGPTTFFPNVPTVFLFPKELTDLSDYGAHIGRYQEPITTTKTGRIRCAFGSVTPPPPGFINEQLTIQEIYAADTLIHHGGIGTILAAAYGRTKQIIIPQLWDQHYNASIVRQLPPGFFVPSVSKTEMAKVFLKYAEETVGGKKYKQKS